MPTRFAKLRLLNLLRTWEQLGPIERRCMESGNWEEVRRIQDRKAKLQADLDTLLGGQTWSGWLGDAASASMLKAQIARLLDQSRESMKLLGALRQVMEHQEAHSQRNLRHIQQIREAYVAPKPTGGGWRAAS